MATASAETGPKVTVVIAIDRSPQAEEAFNWYAKTLHNSNNKVLLVHCPENPTVKVSEGMHLPEGEWQKMKDGEKKETHELITKYTQKMKECGIEHTEYKTMHGPKPGEAIVQAAKNAKATYIVMGTRGMGTIRRTIMGSVSNYVLHESSIPVIICRNQSK